MTKLRAITLVVFALTLTFSGPVFGQSDDRDRMIELSEQGYAAFKVSRYEVAAKKFRKAFEAYPDPVLLKNEMLAWFKAGKCEPAMDAGKSFKKSGEVAEEDVPDINKVFSECKLKLAEKDAEAGDIDKAETHLEDVKDYPLDESQAKRLEELRVKLAEAKKKEKEAADKETDMEDPDGSVSGSESGLASMSTMEMTGWGLVGAGGVILTSGIIYHIISLNRQAEFKDTAEGGDPERYEELRGQLQTARWLVPTLYAAGLLTGGAGGTLLYFEMGNETDPGMSAAIEPAYLPEGGGVRLRLTW